MNITEQFLTPNQWSRPQDKLHKVLGIVVHWCANPNSTAEANRNFFESRKGGTKGFGSAHYVINLDGAVVQCLPLDEMSYHVGSHVYTAQALKKLGSYPNNCTVGIECTHIDDNGTMTKATYDALVELATMLLKKYNLTENDLWTHKTVVGWKDCHMYFVKNNDEWIKFKTLVGNKLRGKAQLNPEVNTNDMHMPEKVEKAKVVEPAKPTPIKPSVTPAPAKKKYVVLPATADSWRIYPLDKAPVKENALNQALNPRKFNGLSYEILGNPQADVYIIQTGSFGKVKIYASPSTGAKIIEK